jgi:putative membrane protein
MMIYGNGMGAGGWVLMSLFGIAVLILLVLAVVAAARPLAWPQQPPSPVGAPRTADAERVLADRFARGDIDAEEYEQRLRTLRAARP